MAVDYDGHDHDRFMTEQFQPFIDRFDRHLENDDKRFTQMTDAVNAVRTSIEVSTSVQSALLGQSKKLLDGKWTKATVLALFLSPIVGAGAIIVAILK